MNKLILSDKTLKLKTKMITLSAISLFIGLTKIIPHEFKLIGVELSKDDRTLGWFILVATVVIFIYFIMNSYLEFEEYNLEEIIQNKMKNRKSEISGITEAEYFSKNDAQIEYENEQSIELMDDIDSFNNQRRNIKNKVMHTHEKFQKKIIFIFEFGLPVILAMIGICSLCTFLIG